MRHSSEIDMCSGPLAGSLLRFSLPLMASGILQLLFNAADIKVAGVAPADVADYAETLLPGTGGIGRYSTFTHIDVRPDKARWRG